jgi:hypothetical protein
MIIFVQFFSSSAKIPHIFASTSRLKIIPSNIDGIIC